MNSDLARIFSAHPSALDNLVYGDVSQRETAAGESPIAESSRRSYLGLEILFGDAEV